MKKDILQLAADLSARGEPYVLAMVVRRDGHSSTRPGDMAVITADGTYHGWVGGSCTRGSVEREASRALADGRPRLVSLSPEPDPLPRPGVTALTMTCHSGGSVDIYLEPVLAAPRVVIFGVSPIARALGGLAKVMGYRVDVVDPDAPADLAFADRVITRLDAPALREPGAAYAVVASMGERDEEAVRAALALAPAYTGVVASRERWAVVRDSLAAAGVDAAALASIKNPAGLDLGGRLPEEAALSILAEIVQLRRAAETRAAAAPAPPAPQPVEAIDPVCHMTVTIATARHTGEWDGRTWYFCNPRCKDKFLADPHRYLDAGAAAPAPAPAHGAAR